MPIFEAYQNTRARIGDLLMNVDDAGLGRVVPACPAWQVSDVLKHLVATPAALAKGRLPEGELNAWLAGLMAERSPEPVEALLAEWEALDPILEIMLKGPASVLFADVAVHEHDLRGALEEPDHEALETPTLLPFVTRTFGDLLLAADLAPVAVMAGEGSWATHDGTPGWTLLVEPWEAVRALSSRRTADELRQLPSLGDPEPYLPVLHAHLPLPAASLRER